MAWSQIAILIGASMLLSLPWAFPAFGEVEHLDLGGLWAILGSMALCGSAGAALLYFLLVWQPGKLIGDLEFRVYLMILVGVTLLLIGFGMWRGDFRSFGEAARYSVFQVVSIQTNTGFGTRDFDQWTAFSRTALVILMFIGDCAGSTSCSVKVIRYILLAKILWLELEQVFHPSVVRAVRLGQRDH